MKLCVAPESTKATVSFQPVAVCTLTRSEKCEFGGAGASGYGWKSEAVVSEKARTWNRGVSGSLLRGALWLTPEPGLLPGHKDNRGPGLLGPSAAAEGRGIYLPDRPRLGGPGTRSRGTGCSPNGVGTLCRRCVCAGMTAGAVGGPVPSAWIYRKPEQMRAWVEVWPGELGHSAGKAGSWRDRVGGAGETVEGPITRA